MRPTITLAHRSATAHRRTMRGPRGAALRMAAKIDAQLAEGFAAYLAECEDYREGRSYEGRARRKRHSDGWIPRRSFTPHYCEHGTDRWTDHDNICGRCEDGFTMGDPTQRMAYALELAHARLKRAAQVQATLKMLADLNVPASMDQVEALNAAYVAALDVDAPF